PRRYGVGTVRQRSSDQNLNATRPTLHTFPSCVLATQPDELSSSIWSAVPFLRGLGRTETRGRQEPASVLWPPLPGPCSREPAGTERPPGRKPTTRSRSSQPPAPATDSTDLGAA